MVSGGGARITVFISDTTLAVAIDYVQRCLWFLCHCFMRLQSERVAGFRVAFIAIMLSRF